MRILWLVLGGVLTSWAQPPADRDALDWAVALRGRIREVHNPVVVAYGTGRLAALVCSKDPVAGSGIFRDALALADGLKSDAFQQKGTTVLPVASFSGLWKFVLPAALKCDANLSQPSLNARARARMDEEHRKENVFLDDAYGLIAPGSLVDKVTELDRAGQLVQAALEAGDPDTLDFVRLTQVLCMLHDPAPDLSDDLFLRAVNFVLTSEAADPGNLQELGKYLFTAPRYTDSADEDEKHESFTVSPASIENFQATRGSANPDCVQAYIEALSDLLTRPPAVGRNAVAAYAVAYQMLPRAEDLLPERVDQLEKALVELEAAVGASAAQVQAALGAAQDPGQDSGSPAARNYRYVGQIDGLLAGGRIAEARALLSRIDDMPAAAQVATLIDFAEASAAIRKKDLDMAMTLANRQRAGVKRSLLYAGVIAAAKAPGYAGQVLQLAMKDAALLPAEQRVRLHAAIGAAVLPADADAGLMAMGALITAFNDQYTSPRKGVFDPRSARKRYNPKADTSTDSALVLPAAGGGFYEAVQLERGRHNFPLKVPGVPAFNMASFLQFTGSVEWARVAAVLAGLRDENTLVNALVDLAGVRLKTPARQ